MFVNLKQIDERNITLTSFPLHNENDQCLKFWEIAHCPVYVWVMCHAGNDIIIVIIIIVTKSWSAAVHECRESNVKPACVHHCLFWVVISLCRPYAIPHVTVIYATQNGREVSSFPSTIISHLVTWGDDVYCMRSILGTETLSYLYPTVWEHAYKSQYVFIKYKWPFHNPCN